MTTWWVDLEPLHSGKQHSHQEIVPLHSQPSVAPFPLSLSRSPQCAKGSDAFPGQPCEGQPPERARWTAVQIWPPQ